MEKEIIEYLSEKVHEAWQEEKHKQGIYNHPDDIPYSQLAENIKEYDRATVRSVLKALGDIVGRHKMTRIEEIEKASMEYRKSREECGAKDPILLDEIDNAYFMGAIWADKHPIHFDGQAMLHVYGTEDKYELALARARESYNAAKVYDFTDDMKRLEYIFPELCEKTQTSEDDDK